MSDMVDAHVAYCKTISDLNMDLAAANERISQLEEQILKAKKQREFVDKVTEEISREEPSNKKIVALLNQHFWEVA